MDEGGERVGRVAVQQDVQFHEPRRTELRDVVVEGGVALGNGLELVVEVEDHLRQGHVVVQLHPVGGQVVLADEGAPLVHAQFHDGSVEIGLGDDLGADIGFFDMVDEGLRREARGIVDIDHLALGRIDLVGHVRDGGDHVHVEFPEQAFLHDLEVQQPQEAAAEAESEGQGALGLIDEGGVVELELLQRGAELLELGGVHRIQAGEDHRLHLLESRDRLGAGTVRVRDGVAHLHFHRRLDAGNDIAHVAGRDFARRIELELERADLLGLVFLSGIEELHLVALADRTVHDLEIGDDAAEGIEHGVEDEGLQGRFRIPLRGRDLVHDGVQHGRYALARAGGNAVHVLRVAAQQVAHLVRHQFRLCGIHVDLVQHRDDLQPVVDGLVQVGNRLRLDALGSVHHEQRPLAGSDAARHLIAEVHVAGGVDEVQPVGLPAAGVLHLDRVALDGDALLPLQVHVVQHLVLHLPVAERTRQFQQPVRQRALSVVDMRDDAKVADVLHNLQRYAFSCRYRVSPSGALLWCSNGTSDVSVVLTVAAS